MKTAHEIFLTVGVPIPMQARESGLSRNLDGFRGFNEHDIAQIQNDAVQATLDSVIRALDTQVGKVLVRKHPPKKTLAMLKKALKP